MNERMYTETLNIRFSFPNKASLTAAQRHEKNSKTETRQRSSAYSETVVDVFRAVFRDCNIFQEYLFSELVTFLLADVKMVGCHCHVAL